MYHAEILLRLDIHCNFRVSNPATQKILGASILVILCDIRHNTLYSQIVTPAMPTHSCVVGSQTASCTLRTVCKPQDPRTLSMGQYEMRFLDHFSNSETLRMSYNSTSARSLSSHSSPRSLPKIYRASSSRLTLNSHLGDSGNHQKPPMKARRRMVSNAIANLQRIWEVQLSMNDSSLRNMSVTVRL